MVDERIEFRVVYEAGDGRPFANVTPVSEDKAIEWALHLKKGSFDETTGNEVLRVTIEERLVIEDVPQAWRPYGTHQGGRR